MSKEILTFCNTDIEGKNYHYKSPIFLGYVDFENVLILNI